MKVLGKTFIKATAVLGLTAAFILTSCQNGIGAMPELEYGSLTVAAGSSDSRGVDSSQIKAAIVTVTGYDAKGTAFEKKSGAVSVSGGKNAEKIEINNIPVCRNAAVTVKAFSDEDAKSEIAGVTLYARTDINSGSNGTLTVNRTTSREGKVYAELNNSKYNYNTNNADTSKISAAIPSGVSYGLINAEDLALDYSRNSLKSSSNYELTPATITVNADSLSGVKFFITDPESSVWTVSGSSTTLTVAPGTWTIYAVDGENVSSESITVGENNVGTVNIEKQSTSTDKIVVHVPEALNLSYCYAWGGSDTAASNWPGKEMTLNGNYYEYTINCSSTNLIFNVGSNETQTGNLLISSAGEYEYTGKASKESSGSECFKAWSGSSSSGTVKITIGELSGPVKPSYKLSSNSVKVGGTFTITVTSNVDLTSSTVTIGGKSKTLTAGINNFNVSDFTSSATTLAVSGTLTNSAGSTVISETITVSEKPANTLITDWNEIVMYQVMVSSFQDGDSSRGYGCAYGPSGQLTGGDLQGIINAADYIAGLGVNTLWMTPIFQSPGEGQIDSTGYFASDYFNIDYHFGTNALFKTLVDTYHKKGINVVLDGVFGHNGGSVAASPNGKYPQGGSNPVSYPGSLEFYEEVAAYWIKEYKIDGWRFDQCYQVFQNDSNYWYEIRNVIKDAAADNGTKGQDWGTLGYTVGENWDGQSVIQNKSVGCGNREGKYGLQSCFDFPNRYQIVKSLCIQEGVNESGSSGLSLGTAVSDCYKVPTAAQDTSTNTNNNKGYVHPEGYYPNLFITNHDLVRFGNLIYWKFNYGPSNTDYWKRHKVALGILGAYTGPITIYYGDEWGAYVDGYNSNGCCGAYNDNAARSTGKISGFDSNQSDLIEYTKKLLEARKEHEALWSGTNTTITSDSDFYVSKKECDGEVIYVAFNSNASSSKTFSATGTDLITGTSYSGTVTVPALSAVYILAN